MSKIEGSAQQPLRSAPEIVRGERAQEAPILCIAGPTAAGKSAVALALCAHFDAELVGADASQVYRDLDIGTAKASAAEREAVAHHLIDVVPFDQSFDAQAYVAHADAALAQILARGKRAVVCGGTGLYFRALLHGLAPTPPVDPAIRARLQAEWAEGRLPQLYARLREVDPVIAARVSARDGQRIERALAVYESTGRPLSDWQAAHQFRPVRYTHAWLGLDRPTPALDARIDARVHQMFAQGLEAEVRGLLTRGATAQMQSFKAIGYRQLAQHMLGAQGQILPLSAAQRAQAIEEIQRASRQYARRQRTWFRGISALQWATPALPDQPQWAQILEYAQQIWGEPSGAV